MASQFAFGFSGDDIDIEGDDDIEAVKNEMDVDIHEDQNKSEELDLIPPRKHSLAEIVRMVFVISSM
jgi:hypothetical protein